MADEQNPTPTAPVVPAQAPATPPAGALSTETPAPEQTVPYARFKEINDKLKVIEEENTKKAKEQQAENEKKLAEQQEWQKLADSRKAKVDELTPKAELAEKLSAQMLEQYAAEIKEWPEQVRAMAPADDADVLVKLDWMKRAKPLAVELMADKLPVGGNGRRPLPTGPAGKGASEEKARAQHGQWMKTQL